MGECIDVQCRCAVNAQWVVGGATSTDALTTMTTISAPETQKNEERRWRLLRVSLTTQHLPPKSRVYTNRGKRVYTSRRMAQLEVTVVVLLPH